MKRLMCNLRLTAMVFLTTTAGMVQATPVALVNPSFEAPVVDPMGFGAIPLVNGWWETDVDLEASTNTGVFLNTPEGSPDRLTNALDQQLAFLGSERGNSLDQALTSYYKEGYSYRLTVGVAISGMFPPSTENPFDHLELALYYYDSNEPVDIAVKSISAAGLSSTELTDVVLYLSPVEPNDPWAGQTIAIGLRADGAPGGFWDLDNVRLEEFKSISLPVLNPSFEAPAVDPNAFPVVPMIMDWWEEDNDALGGTNTGVFINPVEGSPDRILNADATQIAFLGSEQGNSLGQDPNAVYQVGYDYLLTVGVGISDRFPPSMEDPKDSLELVLYYMDGNEPVDLALESITGTGLSATLLKDHVLLLPPVEPNDPWAGHNIGIAIQAAGAPGGFWNLDNVRLVESLIAEEEQEPAQQE